MAARAAGAGGRPNPLRRRWRAAGAGVGRVAAGFRPMEPAWRRRRAAPGTRDRRKPTLSRARSTVGLAIRAGRSAREPLNSELRTHWIADRRLRAYQRGGRIVIISFRCGAIVSSG